MELAGPRGLAGSRPLAAATAAARDCGVTRLADLTGLDRIGVPVWQAVRPWGRSLSVHMGKGLAEPDAQLGALMEAVENTVAEDFRGEPVTAAFDELPPGERAPDPTDFSLTRGEAAVPARPTRWVRAERVLDGSTLWVPFEAVSLDFTWRGDPALERSSNGQAAHFDLGPAAGSGVLELIERDAMAAWQRRPLARRAAEEIDLATVPFDWFADLLGRLRAAGVAVSAYRTPTVTATPAFLCELIEPGEARISAGTYGSACHPSAETALLKALLEAVQSRLTFIAGARDDAFFPGEQPRALGFALPLPPGARRRAWAEAEGDGAGPDDPGPAELAARLAAAGYPDTAVVTLSPPGSPVVVAKAFCPGLAAFDRPRRGPPS